MSARSSHQVVARGRRSVRRLIRGGAILLVATVGLAAPTATLADDCATTGALAIHAGMTPTQRSVVLLEAEDPANFPTPVNGLQLHAGLTPSQRSVVLLEGEDPANLAVKSTAQGLEVHAGMTSTQRSIVLLEAEDPANVLTSLGC